MRLCGCLYDSVECTTSSVSPLQLRLPCANANKDEPIALFEMQEIATRTRFPSPNSLIEGGVSRLKVNLGSKLAKWEQRHNGTSGKSEAVARE